MQKTAINLGMPLLWLPPKFLLIMKLVVILLTACLMQVNAATFAQKLTMQKSKVGLKEIFEQINLQTGYDVIWKSDQLNDKPNISVNFKDMDIKDVLDHLLPTQGLSYTLTDKTIVITKKEPGFLDKLVERFTLLDIGGAILDDKGLPLPGATVKIKGGNKSVVTDRYGHFRFSGLKGDEILVVSYVGYEVKEVAVSNEQMRNPLSISIQLKLASGALNEVEVVNTGYQQLSREKSTGAIATLTSKDLDKRNSINLFEQLEGTVPGLIRSTERGSTTNTIRGIGTMSAFTQPLLVVDGFPLEGSINDINPYDVESINVLKDAAAAAIYGARATNGIIVITTKRATQKNKTVVELNANITYAEKLDYQRGYLSPSQQVDFESEYYRWYFDGASGTITNPITSFENIINGGNFFSPIQYAYYQRKKNPATFTEAVLNETLNQYKQNNFIQDFKNHAQVNKTTQQYNFALRTNNGRNQSSLVLNFTRDNGSLINAYNRNINIAYRGTYLIGRWLDIDYGINSVINLGRSHNNAGTAYRYPIYQSLFNSDGTRANTNTNYNSIFLNNVINTDKNLRSLYYNPLDELEMDFTKTKEMNTRYQLGLKFKPMPGLTITPQFQVEDNNRNSEAYSEVDSYAMRLLINSYTTRTGTSAANHVYTNNLPVGGRLNTTVTSSPSYTARAQVNYNRDFGKHGFAAIAGSEFRQTFTSGRNSLQYGYNDPLQQVNNVIDFRTFRNTFIRPYWTTGTAPALQVSGIIPETKHRFAAGYANLTYTFDHKYNLFGSVRKDYADIFGADERYRGAPLWSLGANWILTNESFIQNINIFDHLKLRASYGLTGNADVNTVSVLVATASTNIDTQVQNASVLTPPNASLRWEKTESLNFGLDFSIFMNLRGNIDVYRKLSTDVLSNQRLDPSEGWNSLYVNNAEILNTGTELTLIYDWLRGQRNSGFSWTTNLVFSQNKNKVLKTDQVGTNTTVAQAGGFLKDYPANALFSFKYAGLNELGQPLFYDVNGQKINNLTLTNDFRNYEFSGVTRPRYTIGFNNDFSFKGFDLSVFVIYNGGHVFRKPFYRTSLLTPSATQVAPIWLADAWTPTNTNTNVPGYGQYARPISALDQIMPYSSETIRPADFIKIRTIALRYNLPQHLVKKIGASNFRLNFQVNNIPPVWTKQKDVIIDIEAGSDYSTGLINVRQPISYVFGFSTNF